MKDFNELKQLWHVQQGDDGVSYNTILRSVKQEKSKYTSKLLTHVISIGCISLITLYLFITVPFYTWTTQLSMFIVVVCLMYYLAVQIRDYRAMRNSENLLSKPEEYISYLRAYKERRYRFNTRNYTIYTLCLSFALALYLIEMSFYLSITALVLFILATMVWFLVCYFTLMKLYIKKESEKLEQLIGKLKDLKQQFGGGESLEHKA